jgi:hypothetical protein
MSAWQQSQQRGSGAASPSLAELERRVLDKRRDEIDGVHPAAAPPRRYRALALSGGGIRSATFALGVLQAIARDRNPDVDNLPAGRKTVFVSSRLSRFDYLSTVSGGGYVGAFLCSLFMPNRLRSHDGKTRAERAKDQAGPGAGAMMRRALGTAWRMASDMVGSGDAPAAAPPAPPPPPDTTPQQRAAADDAVRVLQSGPPERIRSGLDYKQPPALLHAPLAWLRENGRYLVPTGAGDAFYAAALAIRNWLALHYVIGTVLMAAVALVGLARAEAAVLWPAVAHAWESESLGLAVQAFKALGDASCRSDQPPGSCSIGVALVWWSPLLPLALAPVLAGVPLGVAFWLVHERDDGRSLPVNVAMLCTLAIGLALLGLVWLLWRDLLAGLLPASLAGLLPEAPADPVPGFLRRWLPDALAGPLPAVAPGPLPDAGAPVAGGGLAMDRRGLTLGAAAMAILAAVLSAVVALVDRSATMQRVLLTRRLADVLVVTAVIAGIGVVDTLGQTLYLALTALDGARAPALVPAGLAVAISWLARWFGAHAGQKQRPSWVKRLPLTTLAGAAGVLVFLLIGGIWSLFVHWIVWNGAVPGTAELHGSAQRATLVWVLIVILLLAVVAGHFAAFINLSSLQAFYASRLTRAYLGASNGERFENGPGTLSAAEPLPGDQLAMADYFDAQRQEAQTLAPLHIINITVNKTVDPAEQLVQRDRKGQPMAVLPMGFSIDEHACVGFPQPSFVNGMRRPLPVGQWIGTSGAAFSTGIGRETSLGMSLLMGAANVRLGTWWESGLHVGTPGSMSSPNPATWLRHLLGALFRTQTYLSYELRARFLGTQRRWQYLSDGGHFENTGLYELLRRERRVAQVFCCDAGADPKYQFDDLANLIRLARIDLRVEITVQTEFSGVLAGVFGVPRDFRPRARAESAAAAGVPFSDAGPAPPASTSTPCALLLWARHFDEAPDRPSTQIVVIKPRVTRDVPVDICQYADVQPAFPQQTTADQFFDEAQWESYRALGYHLGTKVFNPRVTAELDRLAHKVIGGTRA